MHHKDNFGNARFARRAYHGESELKHRVSEGKAKGGSLGVFWSAKRTKVVLVKYLKTTDFSLRNPGSLGELDYAYQI